jgi:benzoylformate decarboxylase
MTARDRLAAAANPVMVVGPGIDDAIGWDSAMKLAGQLALPVLIDPSPSRCPFPTRHPNYRGILPSTIPGVAQRFEGHDLVVAFGAAIFRHHEFGEGDYLPPGTDLWAVTSDPGEAARAPVGEILIGIPSDALARLLALLAPTSRPALSALERADHPEEVGPLFSAEAIVDALDAAKDDRTAIALEWTSLSAGRLVAS